MVLTSSPLFKTNMIWQYTPNIPAPVNLYALCWHRFRVYGDEIEKHILDSCSWYLSRHNTQLLQEKSKFYTLYKSKNPIMPKVLWW